MSAPKASFHRLRKRFAGDTAGAAALEFSLVAIPFIALLIFSLQAFMIFFFGQALQTLTITAGRQLMIGAAQSQGLTQSQFKTLVCNQAPSVFACQNIMIDVKSAASFSALDTSPITINYNNGSPTNTFSYQPGSASSAVIIRVMYDWPVIGGPLGVGLANQGNGSHLMIGTAVFKSEPYS